MNPVQFARKWCAQFNSDGSCIQAQLVSADGKKIILKPLDRCALNTPIQRCIYFEESVLPQNFKLDSSESYNAEQRTRLAKNQEELEAASHEYRMATGAFSSASGKKCPVCKERGVAPGFRFCPECATERAKEATAARQRKKRALSASPSPSEPKT
ncbi:MAG: hypothetical protein V4563_14930 [Pseudomonadota bacterium]